MKGQQQNALRILNFETCGAHFFESFRLHQKPKISSVVSRFTGPYS